MTMTREEQIQKIKELETELLQLRIETRHFNFTEDYIRTKYRYGKMKISQEEMQRYIVDYLRTLDEPIKNEDLIQILVTEILDLSEYDLEKTNSGNIRIYSTIRTAVVKLRDDNVLVKNNEDLERGQLILTEKYDDWLKRKIS